MINSHLDITHQQEGGALFPVEPKESEVMGVRGEGRRARGGSRVEGATYTHDTFEGRGKAAPP